MVDDRLKHVMWYQNLVGNGQSSFLYAGQVFEVIVRQALAGAPWREVCAGPMKTNGIQEATVADEVEWRKSGRPQRDYAEVSAYQNDVQGGGNCLIVPILGEWDSIRLLNTSSAPSILEDISNSLLRPSFGAHPLPAPTGAFGGGIVFLQFDIYDIVLAQRASDIQRVLPQIAIEKRPKINDAVFEMFDRWYNCPLAICCFNQAASGKAKPLAFAFEPLYPDKLIVYTLDGHDGSVPALTKTVQLDHSIFVGSYLMRANSCANVEYSDQVSSDLRPYLLDKVLGVDINVSMENGDVMFSTEAVRRGQFQGLRSLPPFAPHNLLRLGHTVRREFEYFA
jgi:hypothetical protein